MAVFGFTKQLVSYLLAAFQVINAGANVVTNENRG